VKALVARLDGFGGVLLAGPAVRAVATRATHVTVMCEPSGAPAAQLLPHVDDVLVWEAPGEPTVDEATIDGLLRSLRDAAYDVAVVLTPYGQSPLPAARLLRTARVRRIGACSAGRSESADGSESLLDVSHRRLPDRHEAEAALDTVAAMGFVPRSGDDGRLRVLPAPDTAVLTGNGPYVVVHPGAGAAACAWAPDRCAEAVALLADAGHRVVVTGGPEDTELTRDVSGDTAVDLGGRTDARTLAGVLRTADVVVSANTGPGHLAAATGTAVVSLFSSVPAAAHWAPYGVPNVLLGDLGSRCADTRARRCPVPGHPCLNDVTAQDVVSAVRKLLERGA
jgi:ADP-heptose:LPS heptosyltransferase